MCVSAVEFFQVGGGSEQTLQTGRRMQDFTAKWWSKACCGIGAGRVAALMMFAAIAVAFFAPSQGRAATDETAEMRYVAIAARMAGDENRMRLILDFGATPDFRLQYLENPPRAIIDLPETVFAFPADALKPRGLVRALRYGMSGQGRARMVFELARPARFDLAETLDEADGAVHRLVFDAVAIEPDAFFALVSGSDWSEPGLAAAISGRAETRDSDLTVVIDAGHGGIDGGAEGPSGAMEKNVTLAFAEAFKVELEKLGGVRVAMTRTDDSFLSLSARVRKARQEQADLFVSLHADSIAVKSLRGATVYTLSDKASDELAQSLADQENSGDAIVGARLEDAPEAVASILVDLARTETRLFSTGLARKVIDSFEGQVRLIKNPLRHAGFRVLQAPDVPSVLVEMGYLSNRDDEKLLTDPAWRESTARLLAQSVQKYRSAILAGRR